MPMITLRFAAILAAVGAAAATAPLAAQDPGNETATPDSPTPPADAPPTIFDGDWITVGLGLGYSASYDGSDDYVFTPLPLIQGKLGGIGINPRPAGVAIDLVDDARGSPVSVTFGPMARLNRNRVSQIKDPVVLAYGKLDTAIEVGPAVGITKNGVLHGFDSLSIGVDVLWDVAGAHGGMTIDPSITYFTPLSRAMAVSLALSARHVDDDYAAYYYSVPAAPTGLAVSESLPVFTASGGFDKLGANLLFGYDFDGDLTNGGLAGFLIGGYSRMQGDGARTPFTTLRGDADQWFVGAGVGYTF